MSTVRVRLHLVGDDEALDILAELGRHLPLFELLRGDALPTQDLGQDDVVIIGSRHPRTRDALLRDAMGRGAARHVALLEAADAGEDGARAVLAAADLVRLLLPSLGVHIDN